MCCSRSSLLSLELRGSVMTSAPGGRSGDDLIGIVAELVLRVSWKAKMWSGP